MEKEYCDACNKKGKNKYRIDIPNGYLDVCSKKCGIKELKKRIPDMIYKIE